MKLLILTYNLSRPSFRQRVEGYADVLREGGIECETVLYPRENLSRWKLLRKCSDFDGVLLHKKTLNFFDAFWMHHYARKVIYDFDDAIMYDDRHPEKKPSRRKHTKPFERTVKLADMVIAGNSAYLVSKLMMTPIYQASTKLLIEKPPNSQTSEYRGTRSHHSPPSRRKGLICSS